MVFKDYKEAQKAVGFMQGERPTGDFYATPTIAIATLLANETFGPIVLEPCCGNGAISKVLVDHGYETVSRDLYDWNYGEPGKDFLKEDVIDADAVVTNPPFNLSMEFTRRALECTKNKNGKVAILNRIQWLEGQKRKILFTSSPLSKVYIFSKRLPRFHRYDYTGKQGTSLIGFAWYIFDWKHEGTTRLCWL